MPRAKNSSPASAKFSEKSHSSKNASAIPSATPEWISEFEGHADSLESSLRQTILARPVVSAAVALGVGWVGSMIYQKLNTPSSATGSKTGSGKRTAKGSGKSSRHSKGTLSSNLSTSLSRAQSEFDSLAMGSLEDVRGGITRLVSQDLQQHPFETLATAVSVGFGLGHLDRRHLQQAGVKVLKLLAMRALEGNDSGIAPRRNMRTDDSSRALTQSQSNGGTLYV